MKRSAALVGLGLAVTVELSGCGNGAVDGSPESTAKPGVTCMHRIGSVTLTAADKADVLAGKKVASLGILDITPADGILLEAPSKASQGELNQDDTVIGALHNYIKVNTDATFSKQIDPALPRGDLEVMTFRHAPDAACAKLPVPGAA